MDYKFIIVHSSHKFSRDCSKDGKEVVKWGVGQSGNRPTAEKNKGN